MEYILLMNNVQDAVQQPFLAIGTDYLGQCYLMIIGSNKGYYTLIITYQLLMTILDAVSHFWRYGVSSANKGRDVFM